MMKYLTCDYCNLEFEVSKRKFTHAKYNKRFGKKFYCSKDCRYKSQGKSEPVLVNCKKCGVSFLKLAKEVQKTGNNNFCSSSCAAIFNNANKKTGIRRSKLEIWLESKIPELFPELEFEFNSKKHISSELDIYIPKLKLAFELNGIFHYKPIFGEAKFNQIKENDLKKAESCKEKGISLFIIDTSEQVRFTENGSLEFLDKIVNLIKDRA